MLSQVNYRVPNMRFLRERLTVRASWAVCGCSRGGREPLACGPDQRSCCVFCRTWSSAAVTSPMGSLLSCTAASCTAPRRRCMSHLSSHGPCPCSPTPALLVFALLPCLGAFGCHFSSSSLEACPHLLPQPFFLRAPFPWGLPGALTLTRFCLLQMDLPFLEASALRFGLNWEVGFSPG